MSNKFRYVTWAQCDEPKAENGFRVLAEWENRGEYSDEYDILSVVITDSGRIYQHATIVETDTNDSTGEVWFELVD